MFLKLDVLTFLIHTIFGLRNCYSLNKNYEVTYFADPTRIVSYRTECCPDSSTPFPLITHINSSSGIHSILLRTDGCSVARILSNSLLWSSDCIIELLYKNSESAFICSGKIRVERLIIWSKYTMKSLFESISTAAANSDGSAIEVKLSCFRDIRISESEGGIICGVSIRKEAFIGCSFENVSRGEDGEKGLREFRREECILNDSQINGGENGILTGVMDRSRGRYSFISTNNTSRIAFSTSSSHTFTNCTFTGCTSSGKGAAIYFRSSSSTSSTLSITSCTFTNCSASNTHAVYCLYALSFLVSGCSFVNHKTTLNSAGGIYIESISNCAGVKDSNFLFCSAGCGGGVFILYVNVTGADCEGGVECGIVSGCRFTHCSSSTFGGGGLRLNTTSATTILSLASIQPVRLDTMYTSLAFQLTGLLPSILRDI